MTLIDPFDNEPAVSTQTNQSAQQLQAAVPTNNSTQQQLIDPFDKAEKSTAVGQPLTNNGQIADAAPSSDQMAKNKSTLDDLMSIPLIGSDIRSAVENKQKQDAERKNSANAVGAQVPKEPTSFGAQALAELADQPHAKIVAYAKSRFPNMPLEEALKRYGIINNSVVFLGDDNHLYKEDDPGMAASLIGKAPTIAGQVIGGIGGAVAGSALPGLGTFAGGVAGATAGSAGGELVRNFIANQSLGENKSASEIGQGALKEGLLGAVGEGTGALFGRAAAKAAFKEANPENIMYAPQAATNQQAADALNLGSLSKAEATQDKSAVNEEKALRGLPGSDEAFNQADQIRNPKIQQAVYDILNKTAPADAVPNASKTVQDAAKSSIASANAAREQSASPLYQAAFDSGAKVDVKPVVAFLNGQKESAKGKILSNINQTLNVLKANNQPEIDLADQGIGATGSKAVYDDSVQGLHNAKLAIDEMLNSAGDSAVGNTSRKILTQAQKMLVTQIESASPEYQGARLNFIENSPPVNQLKNGIVGKIADLDPTQLKNTANILFDPKESDPTVLEKAIDVIHQQNPDAVNAITRSYLQSQFEGMKESLAGGGSLSRAYYKKIMGSQKQREMLDVALKYNPDAKENLMYLARVFPLIGSAAAEGSPTAARAAVIEGMKGKNIYSLGRAASEPLNTLKELLTKFEQNRSKNVYKAMADAAINPKFTNDMEQIKKFSPSSKQGLQSFAGLLTRILEEQGNQQFDYMSPQKIPEQQRNSN